jgi:hypothetical protein
VLLLNVGNLAFWPPSGTWLLLAVSYAPEILKGTRRYMSMFGDRQDNYVENRASYGITQRIKLKTTL